MSLQCLSTIRQESDPAKKFESAQHFLQQAKQVLGKDRLIILRKESSFDPAKFAAISKTSHPTAKAEALLYLNEKLLQALAKKITETYAKNNSPLPPSSLYHDIIKSFALAKIFELLHSEESLSSFGCLYFLEVFAAIHSSSDKGTLIHSSVHPYFALTEYQLYRA